ncbi:PREDICTED: protein timeless homolog isoform X1 [Amphimedon queenslandica]|uniref:Timeless C-terminal domain-containing protein n=1 Tax=Amphimedon queenslandica TaxID=400682 RepID=A0AAN0JFZ9_AMPQE|nr:PREDICTED: protein timeless homolog isoform X1 [Amphimedon queenslandica]|eukprot:XP_019855568.1 PREDICTED: protein timeless homolog isoform X1 [Amphimedon queenslandica]
MELERIKQQRSQLTFGRSSLGRRHSNFGGVYITTSSGKKSICYRPLLGFSDNSFDIENRPRHTRIPKNRKFLVTDCQSRPSTYSIRVVLQNICAQVLDYCFNVLMRVVKDTIKRQHSMESVETFYLWAMRFFMEFSRLQNFRVDIVSESLQLPTVHQVLQLIARYYEHTCTCMKKRERLAAIQWGQRLHYAVSAYKELLLHVQEMIQSKDDTVVQSSKVILRDLLYHPEYRDVFLMVLQIYNQAIMPRSFLQDVIEMTHVYLRLVKLCFKQNGQLFIQKKMEQTTAKKKTNSQQPPTEDQLMEMWESLESEIQHVITNTAGASELPSPFDGASDTPIEEQKIEVMKNIHKNLKTQNIREAVLMMKAACEVWPDDIFGSNMVSPSKEISVLKEIFFNPLSVIVSFFHLVTTGHEYEEEEERSVQENVTSIGLEMDLNRFTAAFANDKIVQVYSLALANYKSNTDGLNHAIIKMLHTISIKHEMMPMLFQMSLFRIFSDILDEPPLPRYRELQEFSSRVVADFFILSQQNAMMFAELLIWKTCEDCYELQEGYGAIQRKRHLKESRNVWTREQENELSSLYEQFKNETDIVGCILDALPSEQCRTRGIIVSKLVSKGLVSSSKELHENKTNKEPWSEEEVSTLKSLWQPSDNITLSIEQLSCSFPGRDIRDIKKQLQNLGLVQPSSRKRKCQENEVISLETEPREDIKKKKGKKGNVDTLVQAIHANGYSNQLAWLSTYINDEAKDRELDSEWEELCIVPVEQSIAEALETTVFNKLMISIDLMPPSEQEIYWRIPSSMSPQNLQTIAESLNAPQRDTDNLLTSSPEDEEAQDIQNMSTNSNTTTYGAVSWSDDEDDNSHLALANDRDPSRSPSEARKRLPKEREVKQPPPKRIRVRTQFDSNDDDDDDDEVNICRSISRERDEPHCHKRNARTDHIQP